MMDLAFWFECPKWLEVFLTASSFLDAARWMDPAVVAGAAHAQAPVLRRGKSVQSSLGLGFISAPHLVGASANVGPVVVIDAVDVAPLSTKNLILCTLIRTVLSSLVQA